MVMDGEATLGITFDFHAAHRLMNYMGDCKQLHGHTYKVQFNVTGRINEASGMVLDFRNLKERLWNHVVSYFDHATLLNNADRVLCAFVKGQGWKYQEHAGETTAENIACRMRTLAAVALPDIVTLREVCVWETENVYALVYGACV